MEANSPSPYECRGVFLANNLGMRSQDKIINFLQLLPGFTTMKIVIDIYIQLSTAVHIQEPCSCKNYGCEVQFSNSCLCDLNGEINRTDLAMNVRCTFFYCCNVPTLVAICSISSSWVQHQPNYTQPWRMARVLNNAHHAMIGGGV